MAISVTISDDSGPVAVTGLLELEVRKRVNQIPEAKLVFRDGRVGDEAFALSNSASFAPGAKLSVSIRRDSEDEVELFVGMVVRQRLDVGRKHSNLIIELQNAASVLTATRKSVVHRKQSDKDIISALISEAGLTAGELPDTGFVHEELFQYQCTDWDFMLTRADVLGLLVQVGDEDISLYAMGESPSTAEGLMLDHSGTDEFFELELELDGSQQNANFQAFGWDPKNKKRPDPTLANDLETAIGDETSLEVGEALGFGTYTLEAALPLVDAELQAWVDARLRRSRLALVRGRAVIPGTAAEPLDTLLLAGVGDHFEGDVLITGVTQRYDSDEWRTELELGLDPSWYAREPDINELPAGGLLPPIGGLQLGVVMGFKEDSEAKEHRIQVGLPMLDAKYGPIWAKVVTPDAGPKRGVLFWPTVGDEVVVGFLNQDPRQAVILGSTFSSVNAPPDLVGPPTAENYKKGITTASGLAIGFDDERPAVFIQTPAGAMVELDDAAESVVVSDKSGNKITMNADGVAIVSAGTLQLTAKSDVIIKGTSVDLGPN